MHNLSAKPCSNLLVKSLLTTSSSLFNSSAIILMSTWRQFPHKSPHLFYIFITFPCYGRVRSFIVFHMLTSFQKPCATETPCLHMSHITNWMFWGGSFLHFHKKFDVFLLLNFVSGSTLTSTYLVSIITNSCTHSSIFIKNTLKVHVKFTPTCFGSQM